MNFWTTKQLYYKKVWDSPRSAHEDETERVAWLVRRCSSWVEQTKNNNKQEPQVSQGDSNGKEGQRVCMISMLKTQLSGPGPTGNLTQYQSGLLNTGLTTELATGVTYVATQRSIKYRIISKLPWNSLRFSCLCVTRGSVTRAKKGLKAEESIPLRVDIRPGMWWDGQAEAKRSNPSFLRPWCISPHSPGITCTIPAWSGKLFDPLRL